MSPLIKVAATLGGSAHLLLLYSSEMWQIVEKLRKTTPFFKHHLARRHKTCASCNNPAHNYSNAFLRPAWHSNIISCNYTGLADMTLTRVLLQL